MTNVTKLPTRIVILQRGWVVVGKFSQEGVHCKLEGAYVIRKWGTSNGIGELALKGPLDDTILEESGIIRFNAGTEIFQLDCQTENWPS